jgi:EAL domain-containing protein (putative c-di-GMP-specific phosphodiesterase class I)
LAVNVSPVQLQEDCFAQSVEEILRETGFPPHRLELEITETALMKNEEWALTAIKRLRAQGISFSLDDFGTGYSSLTYLRVLPIDKIKIDRSFVTNVHESIDAATIVHAVVSIGRALGKKVVAEGVETDAQRHFLAAAGVHLLQGFLFARPMPGHQLLDWLKVEFERQSCGAAVGRA